MEASTENRSLVRMSTAPDLGARTVLPLMHEAGLRDPEPAGNDMGSAA